MKPLIAAIFIIGICLAQAETEDDRTEKLRSIRLVFVDGNNQAASHIRKELKKEKQRSCLREALKAEDADAVLEIDSHSEVESGPFAERHWIVSGKLHSKNGEVLWNDSERLEDEPFNSGEKTAAKVLLGHLQEQVCVK
ncbi:MAG: hypothetical protein DMG81_10370 [Acidobacteria bacterium]|nr:MAG: hypothetical protein DMG81_10370 [Acidobacteriota bacterium]HEU0048895.1 hypothetical protein [Nitrososphaera sp.]